MSSAVFPLLADRFWIVATGNSGGRSFGPVLASKRYRLTAELGGKGVAMAGRLTTRGGLAQMYCPEAQLVRCRTRESPMQFYATNATPGNDSRGDISFSENESEPRVQFRTSLAGGDRPPLF